MTESTFLSLYNSLVKALHRTHFFAQTPLSFFFFTLPLDTWLLVKFTLFHFTKKSFLLQLTLENFNRFFDVPVDNSDFHEQSPRFLCCLCGAASTRI